jgi:hypothetical protein
MNANGLISFILIALLPLSGFADCKASDGFFKEGRRYFEREQYLLSSTQFKIASQFACSPNEKSEALFGYALSMNKLGERGEVLTSLEDIEATSSTVVKPRANLLKYLELGAQNTSQLSSDQLKRVKLWEERSFTLEHSKSPALAGVMSAVIPGAGQAYVGAWQSAAYSFLINALFLSAAIELQNKGLYATSLSAGVVFSVTYIGGIISSVQSAKTYNKNQTAPLESKMYQDLFPELNP